MTGSLEAHGGTALVFYALFGIALARLAASDLHARTPSARAAWPCAAACAAATACGACGACGAGACGAQAGSGGGGFGSGASANSGAGLSGGGLSGGGDDDCFGCLGAGSAAVRALSSASAGGWNDSWWRWSSQPSLSGGGLSGGGLSSAGLSEGGGGGGGAGGGEGGGAAEGQSEDTRFSYLLDPSGVVRTGGVAPAAPRRQTQQSA